MRLGLLIVIVGGTLSISVAAAQPTSSVVDGKSKPSVTGRAATQTAPAKSCAEYGPGFVRVEGSTSCVRIGGAISVGAGTSGRGR
jgi:hypothetical protein